MKGGATPPSKKRRAETLDRRRTFENPGMETHMRGGSDRGGRDVRLYNEDEKQKRVKKEIARLRKLYKDLPKDKQSAAEGLIQEAAFMRATLEEARHIIDSEGVLELFEQGEQRFQREHPATKVYNTMVQRYAGVCKQLVDLLPEGDGKKQNEDELMAFVKQGRW